MFSVEMSSFRLVSVGDSMMTRIPGFLYLWIAVIIFAASNSVTRKVTEIGAQHLIKGHNPISLCNVLFVGNLCALGVMIPLFSRQWNQQTLSQLTRQNWVSLATIATLSGALAPGLIFAALSTTNVTNVVLIGRLEPPLTLGLSLLFLKVRINIWTALGSVISFAGVAVTALIASANPTISMMGGLFHVGRGELMIASASFILAVATVVSKSQLQHVPLGIFNIVRVGVGTIIFFILARILYGSQHFAEVFSPFLWKWMLLYGSVIVVAGQLCWFAGLRRSTPAATNLATSFNPIAAIVMAYLILAEIPTLAQYIGGSIILVGVFSSLIGSLQEAKLDKLRSTASSYEPSMGMMTGFRGI